jgi:hypothetical protein
VVVAGPDQLPALLATLWWYSYDWYALVADVPDRRDPDHDERRLAHHGHFEEEPGGEEERVVPVDVDVVERARVAVRVAVDLRHRVRRQRVRVTGGGSRRRPGRTSGTAR